MAALGEEVEVGDEDQRSNISDKKGQMAGTHGCGPLWFLQACATFCQVVEASTVVEEVEVDLTAEVGEEGWCRTGGAIFEKYTFVK